MNKASQYSKEEIIISFQLKINAVLGGTLRVTQRVMFLKNRKDKRASGCCVDRQVTVLLK